MKRVLSILTALLLLLAMNLTASAENTVTVSFLVRENVNGSELYSTDALTVNFGTSVLDALLSVEQLTVTQSGGYVSAIDEYSEFGHGAASGWKYSVNSVFINKSAADCQLRDGDKIVWVYDNWVDDVAISTQPTVHSTTQNATEPSAAAPTQGGHTGTQTTVPSGSAATTQTTTAGSSATSHTTAYTRRSTSTARVPESDIVTAALSYIKSNTGSFTPLLLSLYSQPIPKSLRSELLQQAGADELRPIELERLIINMSALGESFTSVDGRDLMDMLYNNNNIMTGGLNGAIFALMTIPHCSFDEQVEYKYDEDALVKLILQNQNDDGGFSLTFDLKSDSDITAMTLSALAPYNARAEVSAAVERALIWLSANQNDDASFSSSYDEQSSESTAQVLIALKTLGIDIDDDRFVKGGRNVYDALMSFATDSGFAHEQGGDTNAMSTEQALLAIYANNKGENPYTAKVTSRVDEINILLFGGIAFAVLVVSATALIVIKLRQRKTQGKKNEG